VTAPAEPVPIDARALLLGAHPPETLLGAWDRTWVHLAHDDPTRFGHVFQRGDLATSAVGPFTGPRRPSASVRAAFADAEGVGRTVGVPLELGNALYQAGMTLAFNDLEGANPRLAQLAAAVAGFLATRGRISIASFVSPTGHGFPWHIDFTHVLALQIDGRKRWQLGRARVPAPPFHLQAEGAQPATRAVLAQLGLAIAPPDEAELDEVVMSAGDVLYLPPGTWHRASAELPSCHLSVIVHPVSFARLLRATLAAIGVRRTPWRTDVQRLDVADRAALLAHLAARLAEARRELAAVTPEQLAHVLDSLAASPIVRETLLERAVDVL
jgi:ribosomal protein L16 Arg81 hydroxylase